MLNRQDFPLLLSQIPQDRATRLLATIEELTNAQQDGQIYNAEYKAAKDFVNNTISRAWDNFRPTLPIDWRSLMIDPNKPEPTDALKAKRYMMLAFSLSSLNEIKAGKKKIDKIQGFDTVKKQLNKFATELLPLVVLFEDLKDKVVMGRKPSGKTTPVNPNKNIKTCPCCFRPIAVENNKMVIHGFNVHQGFRTFSQCPASNRFPPYETSTEGTKWLLQERESQLLNAKTPNEEFAIKEDIKFLKQMLKLAK